MIQWTARWLLRAFTLLTVVGLVWTLHNIWVDPSWQPVIAATASEIRARVETDLTAAATSQTVATRISTRLEQTPRDWFILDSLHDLALRRNIALAPDLEARFATLRDSDNGWYAQTISCAACALDTSTCSLKQAMVCAAPVQLSPVGDVMGIGAEAKHYVMGDDVDLVSLSLSVVGLGATAAVVATGGASETLQIGAGILKIAKGMGRLPKWLIVAAEDAAKTGVDWERLVHVRWPSDLGGVIRVERFVKVTDTAMDLNRIRKATDTTTALHFLKQIDNPIEARKFANASEALGKEVVADGEILGKSRLLRATLRWSHRILTFFATLFSALASVAVAIGHAISKVLTRGLKRRLRNVIRRP